MGTIIIEAPDPMARSGTRRGDAARDAEQVVGPLEAKSGRVRGRSGDGGGEFMVLQKPG